MARSLLLLLVVSGCLNSPQELTAEEYLTPTELQPVPHEELVFASSSEVLRINAGGPQVTSNGVLWHADQHYLGGKTYQNSAIADIANTTDDVLYLTERSASTELGGFGYEIPVTEAGTYEVKLHFAEIYWGATGRQGGPGSRVFSVDLEGAPVELSDYDIAAEVGSEAAAVKVFGVAVSDGSLSLAFTATVNRPKLSAIEVGYVGAAEPGLGAWHSLAPSSFNRQEVSYVHYDGRLYLTGGAKTHERYDPSTDQWTLIAPLPDKVDHIQGVVVGDLIYYIGGLAGWPGPSVGTVRIYDPATDSFSLGTAMPAARARGAGGIAVHEGLIYYAGGMHDGAAVAWFDVYDPVADTWQPLPDLDTARDHFHAAVVDEVLYAIGGRDSGVNLNATIASVEAYDLQLGTWSTLATQIPTPRGGYGIAVLGDEIVVIGGEGGNKAHAVVEAYRPATNTWRTLSPMPTARHGIQVAVCGGTAFVAAGGTKQGGSGPTSVQEAFVLDENLVEPCVSTGGTEPDPDPEPEPGDVVARINAGGPSLTINGITWSGDQHFTGGATYRNPNIPDILGTTDDDLYRTERSATTDLGTFNYNIPVPTNGTYEVRLHFAEIHFDATCCIQRYGLGPTSQPDPYLQAQNAGDRVFNVNLQGGPIELENYDISADVGPETAVIKTFDTTTTNNTINITLNATINRPKISAIEIIQLNTTPPTNTAPTANDATYTTTQNTPTTITLNATDPDNDPLTYTITTPPTNGTLTGTPTHTTPNLTYTPNPNHTGTDTFTYTANDGQHTSNTATITINTTSTSTDFSEISWTTVQSAPLGRTEAHGGVVNGKLYVSGGYVSWNPFCATDAAHVFDPVTNSWSSLAPEPITWTHTGTEFDGSVIYVAAGYQNENCSRGEDATTAVIAYDTATNTWLEDALPPLPAARGSGGLVRLGRELHFFGGTDTTSGRPEKPDHWSISLDDPIQWTPRAAFPNPRSHLAAIGYGGKIYAIGGQHSYSGNSVAQDSVHAYDPNTDSWTELASLPIPLSHAAAATFVMEDRIIVVGGEVGQNQHVDTVFAYDPADDTWTQLTSLPQARNAGVAGVIDGAIYFTGGSGFRTTTYKGVPVR